VAPSWLGAANAAAAAVAFFPAAVPRFCFFHHNQNAINKTNRPSKKARHPATAWPMMADRSEEEEAAAGVPEASSCALEDSGLLLDEMDVVQLVVLVVGMTERVVVEEVGCAA